MCSNLAPGYSVRQPTQEDIPAILTIIHDFELVESGEVDFYDTSHILMDWEDLDLSKDVWIIIAPGGQPCGYATLTPDEGQIVADGYVHPQHKNRGVGTTLIELMERRAGELVAEDTTAKRLVLINNILANSPESVTLLERHGYELARVYFRMHIELEPNLVLPVPIWPEGVTLRTSDGSPEDIRLAHEVIEDGFRDHWAHIPRELNDWEHNMVRENFDPSLWFFAQAESEIVGAALCKTREANYGWVEQLAVRRPWRKHGLGMALLHETFRTFQRRGAHRVGLGVDGQSLTGAQRLYERAGMHVTMRIGRYEKVLRPGL